MEVCSIKSCDGIAIFGDFFSPRCYKHRPPSQRKDAKLWWHRAKKEWVKA